MKEELDLQEVKDRPGKGSGTKDACYHKVKSRYSVWPSAYASGALVKCRKVGAANWGTKSEAMEMVRYCPKCQKDETRNECKYGAKYWDMFSRPSALTTNQLKYNIATVHPGNFPESYDHEYSMARSELSTIIAAAKRLRKKMKGEGNIEAWVQSKITKAADYLDTAADYVDSGEMKAEQMLPPINPDAHKEAQKKQKLYNKGTSTDNPYEKEIFLKKSGGPQLPLAKKDTKTQVAHYEPEGEVIDEKCWTGYKKKGMKTMFGKRYPNCVKKEEYSDWRKDFELSENIDDSLRNLSGRIGGAIGAAKGRQKFGNVFGIPERIGRDQGTQKGKEVYDKAKQTVGNLLNQSYEYEDEIVEYSDWRTDFGLSEDWQKVNRKDKTDGLSQKAVNAYRHENPGSKLQTAVTEKKPKGKRAKRRKNFCSRMKGMRSKLTSTKTARDPDSRINKALRRWNCN